MIVVFMVAGMSSRYGGKLKQFAPIGKNNEPLIKVSVDQALTAKFKKIIFITNKKTEDKFINYFGYKYNGIPVQYIRQEWDEITRDRPWGTADAIAVLAGKVFEPCIFVNSDDIYGEETFQEGVSLFSKFGDNIVGGCILNKTMPIDQNAIVNRGVIYTKRGKNNNLIVTKMQEMLKISSSKNPELLNELASVNFFGLTPNIIFFLEESVINFKKENAGDRKIEYILPNALSQIIENRRITMHCFEIKNKICGVTYPGDEKNVKNMLNN